LAAWQILTAVIAIPADKEVYARVVFARGELILSGT
jgi:hypothetical protein